MSLHGTTVGVVGAGAMGTGIAQIAAAAGHQVILGDAVAGVTGNARASMSKALDREVEKKKLGRADADALLARIDFSPQPLANELSAYKSCGLVIEAIVEDIDAKSRLFEGLEGVVAPDAVLATNTSSLSVTAIAGACRRAPPVVGLPFFHPAPVFPPVQMVPWRATPPTRV